MSRTTKILTAILLVAIMLLGVGYAAIENITLNITGTASADPSQANFIVKFSGEPTVSDSTKVTAAVSDDLNATINAQGLATKGEIVTSTYTIQNASTDLSADLTVETTNSNTEYFTITSELEKTSLVAGEATTLTVSIELIKVPIEQTETTTIGIQLTAIPVQPGQEGTSGETGGTDDDSTGTLTSTLEEVTNDNIGDYIDLGNNIVGTNSTSDDWRVLYVENNMVYAILADYLPNSTGYAEATGLDVSDEFGVYSNEETGSAEILANGLRNQTAWSGMANGIVGATATGTPTFELFLKSYNLKNETDYEIGDSIEIVSNDLYQPRSTSGYRLDYGDGNYVVEGYIIESVYGYNYPGAGIRPIVELPNTTSVTLSNKIWTVVK